MRKAERRVRQARNRMRIVNMGNAPSIHGALSPILGPVRPSHNVSRCSVRSPISQERSPTTAQPAETHPGKAISRADQCRPVRICNSTSGRVSATRVNTRPERTTPAKDRGIKRWSKRALSQQPRASHSIDVEFSNLLVRPVYVLSSPD